MSDSSFTFTKTENLDRGRSVQFTASATRDAALAIALAADQPFPALPVTLGSLDLALQGSRPLTFGRGSGKVTFSASADAGLAVFADGAAAIAQLGLEPELSDGLKLDDDPGGSIYTLLRWGYDVDASGQGSVALDASGTVSFGADAAHSRLFAVVRRLPATTGARQAIQAALDSWQVPRGIESVDQLDPGTWLIAEVDGSIALRLKAQYGYNMSWVREALAGGLSGDIGLRVEAGVSAALGFEASGRYALAIGRAGATRRDKRLRLRLYKLRKKGWRFALDAGATVEGDTGGFLPGSFEKLIAAVLGLDPTQLMDDVALLRTWADPSKPLSGLLANAGVERARKLVGEISGVDPETAFDDARQRVLGLLGAWDDLPGTVTSRLYAMVEDKVDLAPLRADLQEIAGATQDSLRGLLERELSDVDFFRTPLGLWLGAALPTDLLAPVTSNRAFTQLQSLATRTLALIDGSRVEDSLRRLQGVIAGRLGLDQVRTAVDQASFENLDAWLKARLGAFLDQELDLSKLDAIRTTITTLLDKKDQFYARALEALNKPYSFTFTNRYQASTARTALIDVTFDFAKPGLAPRLKAAIDGRFDRLLTEPRPGVTLHTATLTHGVNRQHHVALELPFYRRTGDRINDSLAKVEVVDDDGRLLLYDLASSDTVTVASRRLQSASRLSVAANLRAKANGVKVRSDDGVGLSYSFYQATKAMGRAALEFQLTPYVDAYFPDHFHARGDGEAPGSFATWVSDLDAAIIARSRQAGAAAAGRATDNIGNTLLALSVSLPVTVGGAWLKAPGLDAAGREVYRQLSRRLQAALKALLLGYYFQAPERYDLGPPTSALLAWAAIPPSSEARFKPPNQVTLDLKRKFYWDWPDRTLRQAMIATVPAKVNLTAELGRARQRLLATPKRSRLAEDFRPTPANVDRVVSRAASAAGDRFLKSLLFVESEVVAGAIAAGKAMNNFRKHASRQPEAAIEALTDFGARVTAAFNQDLASVFAADNSPLRPLGTLLLVAAAQVLDPRMAKVQAAAMLDLTVVKDQVAPFPPQPFPGYPPLAKDDLVIEQRLVSLG